MNVSTLRRQRRLNQTELAKRTGVTQAYIAMLEKGRNVNPTLALLTRLAKALGVSVGYLLGEGLTMKEMKEWWRAEPDRDTPPEPLSQIACDAPGSYATRDEAEGRARQLGYSIVARYQDKGGGVIRRPFPVRGA